MVLDPVDTLTLRFGITPDYSKYIKKVLRHLLVSDSGKVGITVKFPRTAATVGEARLPL